MKTSFISFSHQTDVNRSKFITHLIPYSQFSDLKSYLKEQHPKANHIVYAYRHLNELDQIVEASSDDGEPKGCAGVPALNVLRGEDLINVAVLIVRYFGGIKLGTGGMARAYAKSVKDVVSVSEFDKYEKEIDYSFSTSYSMVDKTSHSLRALGITKIEQIFEVDGVKWNITSTKEKIDRFCDKLEL